MPRTSPVHYIAPSAISIVPNANNTASDLAVYIARGTKIKVNSPGIEELGMVGETWQEWTLAGRNRRLADTAKPYTIYARLAKARKDDGYLVFAAKKDGNEGVEDAEPDWHDKYNYVTYLGMTDIGGAITSDTYWYIKLGDVSLPEQGQRTVDLDTGILGTDEYNTKWSIGSMLLPQRIDLSCQIGGKNAGSPPYVFWGETLVLSARLVEGWNVNISSRVRRWTIERNTGNTDADAAWNAIDRSGLGGFGTTGVINLRHLHDSDDFAGAYTSVFTVTAWGDGEEVQEGEEPVLAVLATGAVTVLAESAEASANARVVTVDRGQWTIMPKAVYVGEGGTYTPDGTLPEDSPYARPATVTDGRSVADPYHFQTISYVTWLQFRLNASYAYLSDRELLRRIQSQGLADLEVSRTWNKGALWECLTDGTTQEPGWDCTDWKVVSGDNVYYCEITSSAGTTFRNGNVDTILTMSVRFGQEEITNSMLQKQGATVQWTRKTGWDAVNHCFIQTPEDLLWQATTIAATGKSIVVVRSDMGSGWMIDYRQAMFCCSIYVPEEDASEVTEYPAAFIQKA